MACYGSMVVRSKFGEPFEVPCGQCIGCRLEKARQWAVRCVHEAQMHQENCFITLTYNNQHLPEDRSVNKRALQLFFKRLRRRFEGKEIRFYASGEYGNGPGHRPHYHACVFGLDFQDKEIHGRSVSKWGARENFLYRSATLEAVWPFGFSTVGELSYESAGYVARYTMKKITGEQAEKHYNGITPEFALMSRAPGIGKPWFDKYKTDVYPKDFFTLNGVKCKPPRYYDQLLEKENPVLLEQIKERRQAQCTDEDSLRKFQKANHRKLITKNLRRRYEQES